MIAVTLDPQQWHDAQAKLAYIHQGAERALARALNKTASKTKTVVSRAIRDEVNLPVAYIRERLKGPANGGEYRATALRLEAKVSTPKRGILLREFVTNLMTARQGRPAVPIKVKVKRSGATETLKSGFWIRTRGSNLLSPAVRNEILQQLGMKQKLDSGEFTVLHAPSISQIYNRIKDKVSVDMTSQMAIYFDHEVGWLLQTYPPPSDDGSAEEP